MCAATSIIRRRRSRRYATRTPLFSHLEAAEHPGANATCDFQNILRSDLDLIEILTPHPLHEAMTVAALVGGSHVSVQKPMAMTLPECDRMIEAAAASGRRLKVFENFVFYPPLVRARELLREGAIGRRLHFRMKVVMADRTEAWRVPDAASRWRHALAAEGRGGPMVFDHGAPHGRRRSGLQRPDSVSASSPTLTAFRTASSKVVDPLTDQSAASSGSTT